MNELILRLSRKHYERGRNFEILDKSEEAIEAYRQACALSPTFFEPYFCLGRLLASVGRTEEALVVLTRALTFGEDPEVIEWRGYVYGRLRRFEEALSDYRRAIPGGPPGVRVNGGRMLLAMGRYDEAREMLQESADPSALPLLDALPRYREFGIRHGRGDTRPTARRPKGGRAAPKKGKGRSGSSSNDPANDDEDVPGHVVPHDDPIDDPRAVRYLFGATLVIGTLGDGGRVINPPTYLLLTYRHCAVTLVRVVRLIRSRGLHFDGVAGTGPHHGPVASAMAALLDLPLVERALAGQRVLLASAVVSGSEEARQLRSPVEAGGGRVIHLALGFVPAGEPSRAEPELIGLAARTSVEWYRVEPWSRLVQDDSTLSTGNPDFIVGPPSIDPNTARVTTALVDACSRQKSDPFATQILAYYRRHEQLRAFDRAGQPPDLRGP